MNDLDHRVAFRTLLNQSVNRARSDGATGEMIREELERMAGIVPAGVVSKSDGAYPPGGGDDDSYLD